MDGWTAQEAGKASTVVSHLHSVFNLISFFLIFHVKIYFGSCHSWSNRDSVFEKSPLCHFVFLNAGIFLLRAQALPGFVPLCLTVKCIYFVWFACSWCSHICAMWGVTEVLKRKDAGEDNWCFSDSSLIKISKQKHFWDEFQLHVRVSEFLKEVWYYDGFVRIHSPSHTCLMFFLLDCFASSHAETTFHF